MHIILYVKKILFLLITNFNNYFMKKLKLFIAALAVLGGVNLAYAQTDVTSTYLPNAGFDDCTAETSDVTAKTIKDYSSNGWTNANTGGFTTIAVTAYGGGVKVGGSATPSTKKDGTTVAGNTLGIIAGWGDNVTIQSNDITLLAGVYTLTVDHYLTSTTTNYNNTSSKFGFVTSGSSYLVSNTTFTASTWTTETITFTLTESTTGKIQIGLTGLNKTGSGSPAVFYDDVTLTYVPFADDTDYGNLNSAISTVEGKAWGFDEGEYAPYNHVAVLETLSGAKAIDQTANNSQITVQGLTATLNGATWTANTEEVNAIFDGSFEHDYSGQTGNVQPLGWYREEATYTGDGYNVRYVELPSGVEGNTSGHGLFGKFTMMYGAQPGYTLPLNEGYYTLNFSYGGWNEKGEREVRLYNNDNSATVQTASIKAIDNKANTTASSYSAYSSFINVPADGNYTLSFYRQNTSNQNQIVIADIVLKTMTVAEAKAYYNSVLDEVDDSYDADANGGSEKTAFKDAIDASIDNMNVAQIMEAADNLYTLRDAFVAATPKYDLYVSEMVNAERIDASITSNITDPTTAAEAEATLKTILVGEFNYVKNNFNADAAATYGITIDQWTGTATSGGSNDTPQTNSGQKWGDDATTYYEQGSNGWGSSSWTLNYTKTVTLPANKYVLKVAARASEGVTATLKATIGETTIEETLPNVGNTGKGITTDGEASFDEGTFANEDNGYGWQWRYLAFTLEEEGEVTLQIDASANSAQQWCSFGDVAVVSNVTTEDMETAYNNFTMQTLGFEQGQYAPYNNVTILEAYAQAKAIVEGEAVPSTQTEVDAITATLTSPSWTANTGDVDAIYNGTFAETGTGNNPKGWTRSNNGWGQQITGLTAETNGVAEGTTTAWYYNNNGAWQYGNDGVYTMPLAANQAYVLSFKYRKQNNDWQDWMKASVTNSANEGLEVAQFPGADNGTTFQSVKAYFTTGAAGNYILSIEQYGNAHLTDVSLVKVQSTEYALSEEATAAPTEMAYYETVALTRTLSANYWNTFSVPFDMAIPDEWTVKEFGSVDGNEINFNDAKSIAAGKPYLVKPTADAVNPTFNGVIVKATEGETMGTGDYKFAAQIYNKSLATDGTVAYLSTNGTIKKLTSGGIKGLRAYFIIPAGSTGARIAFTDGDQTGIKDTVRETTYDNRVYDLQGRQVKAVKKGIYVVNGKKVIK